LDAKKRCPRNLIRLGAGPALLATKLAYTAQRMMV